MKTTYTLHYLWEGDTGGPLMDELERRCPDCVERLGPTQRRLSFTRPEGDPQTQEALRLLLEAGFRPRLNLGEPEPPKSFRLDIKREYEPEDLEGLEYVQIADYTVQFAAERSGEGDPYYPDAEITVVADTLVFGQEIGRLDLEERFLVSEGLKGRMEREVFAHVVLRPVHAVGSPGAVARFETEPYWEWATDLISPPPAQGPARFVRGGRPLAPDEVPASGVHSREGWEFPEVLYPLEVRFRRRDMEEVGPFDLAAYHSQAHGAWLSMTNHPERRGRTDLPPLPVAVSRPRIASRRFFEFCVREGLPFTWRPVYVVD